MEQDQSTYWDRVAEEKTFTHPLNVEWLKQNVPTSARWLDFGCGYGRLCGELKELGYRDVVGLDFSPAMIERGRRQLPDVTFVIDGEESSEVGPGRFDAVLLFSIWTCNPELAGLEALMARVRRLLRPGGLVYVSDLLLQEDERNRQRYAASGHDDWGTFELEEGARLRHFDEETIRRLVEGFEERLFEPLDVRTMNGHAARGFQYIGSLTREG